MLLEIRDNYSFKELLIDISLLCILYMARKFRIRHAPFPRINGVYASNAQLELAEQLGVSRRNVNYKVGPHYIDIAYPNKKIAIEYNGKFWHKGKRARDRDRANQLVKLGWKVLVITVDGSKVPTNKWVRQQLQKLKTDSIVFVEYK